MRRGGTPSSWHGRRLGGAGLALGAAFAAGASAAASSCWSGAYTEESCCGGAGGNPECWDGVWYTFETCCSSATGADQSGSAAAADEEDGLEGEESISDGDSVLFNEQLPGIVTSMWESLQEHAVRERKGRASCHASGEISDQSLRLAREEVKRALREAGPDPEVRMPLETPGIDRVYKDYVPYLHSCPQAVLQGSVAKLDRMLMHLRSTCGEQSLIRACQATTPFMFDLFLYYVLLKYAIVELYAVELGGNVTAKVVFRGWPIEEHEARMWHLFGALWRTIWPQRDYCACVEAYDYYATLHAFFDGSLHLDRPDFAGRLLRESSEAWRVVQAASHCEEWINKDFQRIFSSYAKHSACLPGGIMENVVCMHRWLLAGKVMGAVNTAEMMVKLLTLSGTCLEDTRWPFTRADVEYNFVRLALRWQEADVGCQAMDRFGQKLQQGPCPTELGPKTLRRLFWAASPLQPEGEQTPCVADFVEACVVDGVVTIARPSGASALPREVLHTCSETGNHRHPLSTRADISKLWHEEDHEIERSTIGFVLNVPEASNNIWHNVHWLVPAAARLYGDETLRDRVPREVALLVLFEGYTFSENEQEPGSAEGTSLGEQMQQMEAWVVRQAGLLQLLTASPPVLFRGIKQRCFGRLLWGHAEFRADRELRSRVPGRAAGRAEVQLFREALRYRHGWDLDLYAKDYWKDAQGAGGSLTTHVGEEPVAVLLVQREKPDLRLFEDLEGLAAVGLEPLARKGEVVWRIADDLPLRSIVQQAAILSTTDVLVGAVGAALAWLIVMRPGGQVLEWLPRGVPPSLYRCSEAWNVDSLGMFGGLGRLASVDHVCLRSEAEPPVVPERLKYSAVRSTAKDAYWRRENLRVDGAKFARWAAEAVRRAKRSRLRGG